MHRCRAEVDHTLHAGILRGAISRLGGAEDRAPIACDRMHDRIASRHGGGQRSPVEPVGDAAVERKARRTGETRRIADHGTDLGPVAEMQPLDDARADESAGAQDSEAHHAADPARTSAARRSSASSHPISITRRSA